MGAVAMPKFYCEYCDLYLTHSGVAGRRQHLTGRRHINNKIEYYQTLIREKGLTPPIYPPPPGMVLPMPKLPAAAKPAMPWAWCPARRASRLAKAAWNGRLAGNDAWTWRHAWYDGNARYAKAWGPAWNAGHAEDV